MFSVWKKEGGRKQLLSDVFSFQRYTHSKYLEKSWTSLTPIKENYQQSGIVAIDQFVYAFGI